MNGQISSIIGLLFHDKDFDNNKSIGSIFHWTISSKLSADIPEKIS